MGCSSSKTVAVPRNIQQPQPQAQADFFDKYELVDVIGRGAYGTVHLTHNVESQERFAVKILDLRAGKKHRGGPAEHELRKDVRAEQLAWDRIVAHPNVVGLQEYFLDDKFAYFVMEFCGCSLLTAWMNEPDLNEFTYAPYFQQMVQALAHIHNVGVVHRDVKQDNFMLGGPEGRTVKLCDFGLSAVVGGRRLTFGGVGSAPYMAPEMVHYTSTHGRPADVWSFGVIVYIAFFGRFPYEPRQGTQEEMHRAIREDHVPPCFAPPRRLGQNVVSEVGLRFVRRLLDRDQRTRPTAAACLQMTFFDMRRRNQLQADDDTENRISLAPHLHVAQNFAFTVKPPMADAHQELNLMRLQSAAQMRREPCLSSQGSICCSSSTAVAVSSKPRAGLFHKYILVDATRHGANKPVRLAHNFECEEGSAVKVLDLDGSEGAKAWVCRHV